MACTRRCGLMTQMTIGVVLSLLFSILVIVWPTIFLNILRNMSVLTKDSYSFNLWKETPLPMYLELYLYNFTNSREVLEDNSIKPHFVDVGPYVFQERHFKVNLTWHDNGTVTFLQRRVWHFDPDLSKGDLSDEITNINIIAVTAGYMVRHRSLFVRLAVSSALNVYEKLIITKTARELLFEGYSDGLLEVIKTLNIPEISLPFDQFGWFYGRNNTDTYDGWWNIQTGANDLKTLGDMDLWNFNDRVDYYDGECGAVKGGTGELFAPRTDPEIVSVFASDICSYISLKRNGSAEMRGLKGAVFTGDDSPFDNGDRYPNEACFCHKGDVCVPAGSRNISQCKFGAPAFISYPHFYLADPSYVSRIDGVTPNETLDQFKLGLNLATGIPLFVRAQLQINILLQRIPNIAMFEQMPDDLFIPMLWFKQEVTIDEELASKARIAASIENIISIVLYTLIGIGVVLFCVGLFLLYKFPLRRTESEASLIR